MHRQTRGARLVVGGGLLLGLLVKSDRPKPLHNVDVDGTHDSYSFLAWRRK